MADPTQPAGYRPPDEYQTAYAPAPATAPPAAASYGPPPDQGGQQQMAAGYSAPPPPAYYGPPPDQGQYIQQQAAPVPATQPAGYRPPDEYATAYDPAYVGTMRSQFGARSMRPDLPSPAVPSRNQERVAPTWLSPNTPGSPNPLLNRPVPPISPWDVLSGMGSFLSAYGSGRRNLLNDLTAQFMPYDMLQSAYGDYQQDPHVGAPTTNVPGTQMLMDAARSLPQPVQYLTSLGRQTFFANPQQSFLTPAAKAAYDQTDAYLANDPHYLTQMANMPEYMRPLRPLIAQAAHAVTALPSPYWSPPPPPGVAPPSAPTYDTAPLPGPERGRWNESPEPGLYYDDPFIPGPDHGRRRRIA